MKEKYLRPEIVNAGTLEIEGIFPWAVTATKAAALLAGLVAGRLATKAVEARPTFKLPSLTKGRDLKDDFCMA